MKTINENYFKNSKESSFTEIEHIIDKGEQILWRGKPKKSAYIFGSFFKMFPIALLWLLFDGTFIVAMCAGKMEIPTGMIFFLIIFFAFHLLPVWIWIGNIITASKQYKNLEYVFTNKRIIIKSGIIGIDFQNIYYSEIQSVNLKVGLFDKMLKVGDVYIKSNAGANVLFDISDPYFITKKLQEIVIDIKTDIEFPNKFRPDENPGYKTAYVKSMKENKGETNKNK